MLNGEQKRGRGNTLMLNVGCVEGKQRGGGRVGGMQWKVGGGVGRFGINAWGLGMVFKRVAWKPQFDFIPIPKASHIRVAFLPKIPNFALVVLISLGPFSILRKIVCFSFQKFSIFSNFHSFQIFLKFFSKFLKLSSNFFSNFSQKFSIFSPKNSQKNSQNSQKSFFSKILKNASGCRKEHFWEFLRKIFLKKNSQKFSKILKIFLNFFLKNSRFSQFFFFSQKLGQDGMFWLKSPFLQRIARFCSWILRTHLLSPSHLMIFWPELLSHPTTPYLVWMCLLFSVSLSLSLTLPLSLYICLYLACSLPYSLALSSFVAPLPLSLSLSLSPLSQSLSLPPPLSSLSPLSLSLSPLSLLFLSLLPLSLSVISIGCLCSLHSLDSLYSPQSLSVSLSASDSLSPSQFHIFSVSISFSLPQFFSFSLSLSQSLSISFQSLSLSQFPSVSLFYTQSLSLSLCLSLSLYLSSPLSTFLSVSHLLFFCSCPCFYLPILSTLVSSVSHTLPLHVLHPTHHAKASKNCLHWQGNHMGCS